MAEQTIDVYHQTSQSRNSHTEKYFVISGNVGEDDIVERHCQLSQLEGRLLELIGVIPGLIILNRVSGLEKPSSILVESQYDDDHTLISKLSSRKLKPDEIPDSIEEYMIKNSIHQLQNLVI